MVPQVAGKETSSREQRCSTLQEFISALLLLSPVLFLLVMLSLAATVRLQPGCLVVPNAWGLESASVDDDGIDDGWFRQRRR